MQWGNWYALRSYVRASLWIAPVLALLLQQVLMRLAIEFESSMPWMPKWPLGASGTLAAMQAIIGLTTSFMIFSFGSMLVAIQIAGGQLTPRVIATTLLRDNVVRMTTGLFVFSLLFSIGTVSRIETDVPDSVAWIASFLGMLSLVAFLYLIDHAARFLRPVSILWHVADVGLQVIDKVFPDPVTEPDLLAATPLKLGKPTRIVRHVGKSSVVVAADIHRLISQARHFDGTIVAAAQVGDFISTGQPLFLLYGGAASADDDRLRATMAFGLERTIEQDSTFALRVIVDIAVKALSTSINDPTTAVLAMDQLQRLLRTAGERNLHNDQFRAKDGALWLVFPTPDWDDFVHLTCREIRHYGAGSIQVARRMRAMLQNLTETLPEIRRPALRIELELLDRAIDELMPFEEDRRLARIVLRQLYQLFFLVSAASLLLKKSSATLVFVS